AIDYYISEATTSAFPLNLLPGQHRLAGAGGGDPLTFTVRPDDPLDYDSALDNLLSGRGTHQLTVVGKAISIDVSALSTPDVAIDYYISDATSAAFPVNLLPGQHRLQGAGGGDALTFTVRP